MAMGIHAVRSAKNKRVRLFGLVIEEVGDLHEVTFGKFAQAWPLLTRKLENQSLLDGIEMSKGKITLKTQADFPLIQSLMSGHVKKSKFTSIVLATASLLLIGMVSLIPLGSGPEARVVQKKITASKDCDYTNLSKWLEGVTENAEAQAEESSILGGVTVGIIECNGSRYSYTLGSEKPKRVLKLQELNS